jgi:hypothetical protein
LLRLLRKALISLLRRILLILILAHQLLRLAARERLLPLGQRACVGHGRGLMGRADGGMRCRGKPSFSCSRGKSFREPRVLRGRDEDLSRTCRVVSRGMMSNGGLFLGRSHLARDRKRSREVRLVNSVRTVSMTHLSRESRLAVNARRYLSFNIPGMRISAATRFEYPNSSIREKA